MNEELLKKFINNPNQTLADLTKEVVALEEREAEATNNLWEKRHLLNRLSVMNEAQIDLETNLIQVVNEWVESTRSLSREDRLSTACRAINQVLTMVTNDFDSFLRE